MKYPPTSVDPVNEIASTSLCLPRASPTFPKPGNTFNTPILSNTTNFYLTEEGSIPVFGGPVNFTIGAGSYYQGNQYLIFDSYTSSKLISALIYADTSNTVTFELRDNNGTVIDDTVITVVSGPQTIILNFDIPPANDLQLGINGINSGLFRNNNGASFPYTIGNLVTFTGASNQSTQDNWYFYYNIEIMENCKSEYKQITAVLNPPLAIPIISQNGNQLSTIYNSSYSYQWYINGVVINGANSNTINITQAGIYKVEINYNRSNNV